MPPVPGGGGGGGSRPPPPPPPPAPSPTPTRRKDEGDVPFVTDGPIGGQPAPVDRTPTVIGNMGIATNTNPPPPQVNFLNPGARVANPNPNERPPPDELVMPTVWPTLAEPTWRIRATTSAPAPATSTGSPQSKAPGPDPSNNNGGGRSQIDVTVNPDPVPTEIPRAPANATPPPNFTGVLIVPPLGFLSTSSAPPLPGATTATAQWVGPDEIGPMPSPPVCGDGRCDITEGCARCAQDCSFSNTVAKPAPGFLGDVYSGGANDPVSVHLHCSMPQFTQFCPWAPPAADAAAVNASASTTTTPSAMLMVAGDTHPSTNHTPFLLDVLGKRSVRAAVFLNPARLVRPEAFEAEPGDGGDAVVDARRGELAVQTRKLVNAVYEAGHTVGLLVPTPGQPSLAALSYLFRVHSMLPRYRALPDSDRRTLGEVMDAARAGADAPPKEAAGAGPGPLYLGASPLLAANTTGSEAWTRLVLALRASVVVPSILLGDADTVANEKDAENRRVATRRFIRGHTGIHNGVPGWIIGVDAVNADSIALVETAIEAMDPKAARLVNASACLGRLLNVALNESLFDQEGQRELDWFNPRRVPARVYMTPLWNVSLTAPAVMRDVGAAPDLTMRDSLCGDSPRAQVKFFLLFAALMQVIVAAVIGFTATTKVDDESKKKSGQLLALVFAGLAASFLYGFLCVVKSWYRGYWVFIALYAGTLAGAVYVALDARTVPTICGAIIAAAWMVKLVTFGRDMERIDKEYDAARGQAAEA
ncbi:hypothetical protein H9P43_005799 [Blastocladiella emersonii ATCC 22665]|nr:hypothetical protein H9P43_005799 [Blastocladiella emersonii ATCC 22665]